MLFLNPSGQLGGAERSLIDILESLRSESPPLDLHLLTSAEGPLVQRIRETGLEVTVLPLPSAVARLGDGGKPTRRNGLFGYAVGLVRWMRAVPPLIGYLARLRRAVRRIAPDVIHSNGFKMHILGIGAAGGTPVVWHVHDFIAHRPMMARVLRTLAGRCGAAIANSRAVQAEIEDICGPVLPVYLCYNAVDLERFSPSGPVLDLDELAGFGPADPGTVRVGFVGTFAWWKGHLTFLDALSRLSGELPFRAYIIGGPVYETEGSQHSLEDLRARTRDLGLADRVAFTGFVDDADAAIRYLDVVVHASTRPEPFGLVIAEAMACGRPVIISSAGGAAELVTLEETGLGHRPGDVTGLVMALDRLLRHEPLRKQLGEAARESAISRFDRRRLPGDLVPIYQSVHGASA